MEDLVYKPALLVVKNEMPYMFIVGSFQIKCFTFDRRFD